MERLSESEIDELKVICEAIQKDLPSGLTNVFVPFAREATHRLFLYQLCLERCLKTDEQIEKEAKTNYESKDRHTKSFYGTVEQLKLLREAELQSLPARVHNARFMLEMLRSYKPTIPWQNEKFDQWTSMGTQRMNQK
jgi:hypothetical protein